MDMVETRKQCEICSSSFMLMEKGASRRYCYECSPMHTTATHAEILSCTRRAIKKQLISEFGGKCRQCGYDKSMSALHFHHTDPSKKVLNISSKKKMLSMSLYRLEASKCEILCINCHRELHWPEYNILRTNEETHLLLGAKIDNKIKKCAICSSMFYSHVKGYARKYCYECVPFGVNRTFAANYAVNSTNRQIINELGGKCVLCGYDKNRNALRIHCKDENAKIGKAKSGSLSKDVSAYKSKAEDCVLLCTNCYSEIHEINQATHLSNEGTESRIQKYVDKSKQCTKCGKHIDRKSKSGLCSKCFSFTRRVVERPTKEVLLKQLETMPFTDVAKIYKVSDNAIRQWCRKYGIPTSRKEISATHSQERATSDPHKSLCDTTAKVENTL